MSTHEYNLVYSREYHRALRAGCTTKDASDRARDAANNRVETVPAFGLPRPQHAHIVRKRQRFAADMKAAAAGRVAAGLTNATHPRPSLEAIREMERIRNMDHPTLTAALMGDPMPGRSALDQQNR